MLKYIKWFRKRFKMKIIITEEQANELTSSMLEDMFKGYEIKFEGDFRNIYVDGKLMAQLGPTKGVVSADAYNELKDNLFFSSDKDLKREVTDWVADKFGGKGGIVKYGVSFKKLHGSERDIPKVQKPRDPRGAEKGYDIEGFRERTKKIENRLKNREDLIRLARQKTAKDTYQKSIEKEMRREAERESKRKESIKKALGK
jgi:hypothetical protein